jgi:hypothetical protein
MGLRCCFSCVYGVFVLLWLINLSWVVFQEVLNMFWLFCQVMKCDICAKKLGETFLEKVIGGVVKDAKGKKHWVCDDCQRSLKTKDAILAKL